MLTYRAENVASVASINSLQASVAFAQRQVQQDQTRVSQDASQLADSQQQLVKDKQDLGDSKQQVAVASQPAAVAPQPVQLNDAIEKPLPSQQHLPADLTPPKPQINTLGQTIGSVINITA